MAKTDFELAEHYRDNRPNNVTLLQAHAFDHYSGRCPGHSPAGGIPNPPIHRDMACPICGELKGLNDFSEDHCPQKSALSTFGPPACVVRVCKTCNNTAGHTYEAEGAAVRRGEQASAGDVAVVGVGIGPGIDVTESGTAELAMDLKSAFLIAFVTLGYAFAFGRGVQSVRAAILSGEAPSVGGPADMSADFPDFCVGLLKSKRLIVAGAPGTQRWWLPCGDDRPVHRLGSENYKPFFWPHTVDSGNRRETDGLLSEGRFFHADYCGDTQHHHELGARWSGPWSL